MGPLRESDLIAGLRDGDPGSYASVFRAYHASLCGFAYGYLHNRADADEIVQDLFLALWRKRERLEITTSLRSYLFRAVRNRVLNRSAQARLEERWLREADNEELEVADPAPAPDEALLAQELETRARRAMDSLPSGCRRVLQLRWVDQLRPQEIADVLGISLKGVENQLARARKVMRQQLGSDSGPGLTPAVGASARRLSYLWRPMSDRIDFDRLDRHLSGDAPANGNDHATLAAAEAIRTAMRSESPGSWNTEASLAALNNRMRATRLRRRWTTTAVAAAAVVVLAIGGLLTRREVAKRDAKAVAHASMVEFRTEIGERRVVRLPDGSSVTLAPVSVLRAPATFAENGRAVELKGEAFFVVMPDSARPFTVESGRATVRVLGTSFNVRAYDQTDDHSEVSVVVVTGRVSLRDEASKQSVVATPGQAATLSAAGNLVVRDSVQVSDYTGWVNGRLVFRDRTLASVVSTLERWYGVDIQIQDSTLARERLTAVLTNQSLNEALDALAATVGASYERHDHLILLRK